MAAEAERTATDAGQRLTHAVWPPNLLDIGQIDGKLHDLGHSGQAMLLRFGVQNFRSIRDMQELSLVASSLDDTQEGVIDCAASGERLLPAVVVYGANASGKSNLVKALAWMQAAVLDSQTRGDPDAGIPREPFALNSASTPGAPTLCDVDFVIEGVRYHYGFAGVRPAFTREWLYSFP